MAWRACSRAPAPSTATPRAPQAAGGFAYDLRSAHVFKAGAEVVVDAYAPSADFPRLDREVFRPLLASLEVSQP